MIDESASSAATEGFEFRLRPNRSITASGLVVFFMLLAALSIAVAWFSSLQGNVFAPMFAAVELSLVWLLLRFVWRTQDQRHERIAMTVDALTVASQPPGDEVKFQTPWVRVHSAPARSSTARRRLLISSHGRSVEVGTFLADEELELLERKLLQALAALRGIPVPEQDNQAIR